MAKKKIKLKVIGKPENQAKLKEQEEERKKKEYEEAKGKRQALKKIFSPQRPGTKAATKAVKKSPKGQPAKPRAQVAKKRTSRTTIPTRTNRDETIPSGTNRTSRTTAKGRVKKPTPRPAALKGKDPPKKRSTLATAGAGSSHKGCSLNDWTEEDMETAIKLYQDSRKPGYPGKAVTYRNIDDWFGIPKSTINNRINQKSKHHVEGMKHASGGKAQPRFFYKEEEDELAEVIIYHARAGLGFTPTDVKQLAFEYAETNHLPLCRQAMEREELTWKWYYGFLDRYPEITPRTPQEMAYYRAMAMKPIVIDNFFDCYEGVIEERGIISPLQVWNIDESGIIDNPKIRKLLGVRGEKCNILVPGEKGELSTVLSYINAAGLHVPPMVIHKGGKLGRVYESWKTNMMPGCQLRSSESGWITKELFTDYGRTFVEYLDDRNLLDRNHLLVMDGHRTHTYNYEFLSLMAHNDISVVTFPSHATAIIQPWDTIPAHSLKRCWNGNLYRENRRKLGRHCAKNRWFFVFTPSWRKSITVTNIRKAFEITGLWPVDRRAIPKHKYDINTYVEDSKIASLLSFACLFSLCCPVPPPLPPIYTLFRCR